MPTPRLIALILAGIIALGFLIIQCVIWHRMRDMPVKRRLANMLYPASQLVLIALCIVSDALLIRSVSGYWRTLDERKYAEKLEQRMQEQLDGFTRLNAQIASTAHLRHDMRNHLLVLSVFVDQGEFEQASAYADGVLAELEKVDHGEVA